MGYGSYSYENRTTRATTLGYTTKSTYEIFQQKNINSAMSPYGVDIREARDSEDHPESFPIVIALDVTGSMGSVPHFLVKEGLPNLMKRIIDDGIKSPQVLFVAVGDHECDSAPLQVGQFEASDELLDKWLTDVYLEGGGGGNSGESYHLAWYFAGKHTVTDSLEKRGKKGVLITIGDEPVLRDIPLLALKNIMGDGQYETYTAVKLFEMAQEKYDCYHLHIKQTNSGSRKHVQDGWKQLLGDKAVMIDRREDVAQKIADIVINSYKVGTTENQPSLNEQTDKSEVKPTTTIKEEILL